MCTCRQVFILNFTIEKLTSCRISHSGFSHFSNSKALVNSMWVVVFKFYKWGPTIRGHNVFVHGKMPNIQCQ